MAEWLRVVSYILVIMWVAMGMAFLYEAMKKEKVSWGWRLWVIAIYFTILILNAFAYF